MRVLFTLIVCLSLLSPISSFTPASTSTTDTLAITGLENLKEYHTNRSRSSNCTYESAAVRKEWSALSVEERITYTDAALCLQRLPPKSDLAVVSGARSRYDDFVAVHINMTLSIHATANFLTWHRYFIWLWEKALREECGYSGYQPYWNWGKYALDPQNSPLFDGSNSSISGNGVYEAHNCTDALLSGINCIPAGSGGGCVVTGPFKNMTVNLGPISQVLLIPELHPSNSTFAYNPRCLRRDISSWVSSNWTTEEKSVELLQQNDNILSFQNAMQGNTSTGNYGVHGGGHFTVGGDPGGDFYSSAGDPYFWLHHSQIDRTYTIWQNLDLPTRQNAIGGTITLLNDPPSRNGTLDDWLEVGVLADKKQIRQMMSTLGGSLCYRYE